MKIGFYVASLAMGGAERVVVRLSKEFLNQGHSVTIYTTMDYKKEEYQVPQGVNRVKCISKSFLGTMIKFRKHIKKDSVDCLIIMGRPLSILAELAVIGSGIRTIVSERSSPKVAHVKPVVNFFANILMRRADAFVFQTESVKNEFGKLDKGCFVVPNPIDLSELPVATEHQKDKRVVAVGRLRTEKNYPMLISAFSHFSEKHPDYTLEIYGEGIERDNITRQICEMNMSDRVFLMGHHRDVIDLIRNADIYVLSSSFEGMPNALIEAMAVGLPVISTDCPSGGPRDLIENGVNGLLVPNNDADALSKALNDYAENSDLSDLCARNALMIRERLRVEKVAQQWLEIIQELIRK